MFLSHWPMFVGMTKDRTSFETPHRFQLIMEATFETSRGKDLTDRYRQARQQHPAARMYSLEPSEHFVLPQIFAPVGGGPPLSAFGAKVFFGHLERGGRLVPGLGTKNEPILARIRRVVHVHEFRPGDLRPKDLEYILFGKGDELFLAHLIAAPGDFDQILPVSILNRSFSDEDLNRGLRVRVDKHPNTALDRLQEAGQHLAAHIRPAGVPQSAGEREVTILLHREIYFEESELAIPADLGSTPLEREAGF